MLPKIDVPRYTLKLPSTGKKIEYRRFLVKEEKILLLAMESEAKDEIINATQNIIENCVYGDVDVNELPTFDLEYIFLQIRAKSVGEIVKLKLLCPDDNKTYAEVEIDLSKVEVHVDEDHTNKIVVDEKKKIGLIMSYPTINSVDPTLEVKGMKTKQMFELLTNSIYQIYEGDKMHSPADYSKEELNKFIESLDSKAFQSVNKFFDTMPKLKHTIKIKNPKTKKESEVVLSGLSDFFE